MSYLPEKIKHIEVSAFNREAGSLAQPSHFEFNYLYDNPVSITMDYQRDPINYGAMHPVFEQNLPEGYVRRYIIQKLMKHATVNDMYLLALQGNKGIGHLSYFSAIKRKETAQLQLKDILTWQGKDSIFALLLDKYYLNGLVSGVQPKVLINANNNTDKPMEKSVFYQNDFIVKTFDEEFPLLTVNEYVCMEAARACKLKPAQCWVSNDFNTFITERFDDTKNKTLAVEDFTVLMGKVGNDKYMSSYESVLKATRLFTNSQVEIERMYEYIVFNCLIGNGDAHLKNFAIQYNIARTNIELTPPYDITHTIIYDTVDNKMALKMEGVKTFPDRKRLIKLGLNERINKPDQIIDRFADTINDHLKTSEYVDIIPELKFSILNSVKTGTSLHYSTQRFVHDKKRKFE